MHVHVQPLANREQLRNAGLGIIAQTYDLSASGATGAAVGTTGASSSMCLGAIGLRAGDSVTGAVSYQVGAANTPTLAKMGLFTSSGTFLKATADFSASLAASTYMQFAFSGGAYKVTADGVYYLSLLTLATTTQPTFVRGMSLTGAGAALSGGLVRASSLSSKSDIAADATISAGPASSLFWLAAYGTAV